MSILYSELPALKRSVYACVADAEDEHTDNTLNSDVFPAFCSPTNAISISFALVSHRCEYSSRTSQCHEVTRTRITVASTSRNV